jgi:hypothetical protein
MRGAIPPLTSTSSWRGAYLSTGTTLPLLSEYQAFSDDRENDQFTLIIYSMVFVILFHTCVHHLET